MRALKEPTQKPARATQETFSVREFARLAGVSVRTLHFYDEAGLLKPSWRTEAGHRLYRREDLLRLQQIVTLKYIGFSLSEIDKLLNSPVYDVRKSLRIQKQAIDQRIGQLQQVSRALDQTLETITSEQPEQMDWQQVDQIIKNVIAEDWQHWSAQYYTPEQQKQLLERSQQISPEELARGQREWQEVIKRFEEHRHDSPAHPELQKLAAKMNELILEFTQGDPGINSALKRMYQDYHKMPSAFRSYDQDIQDLMWQAIEIYHQNHKGCQPTS
jgi:DNA-binding transcriptional MerR regulator